MVKIAVLVSGGGTNLQAILDSMLFGEIKNCELRAVISSSPKAYALTRAQNAGIPHYVVDKKNYPNRRTFTDAIVDMLTDMDIELVVLAGFLYILTSRFTTVFEGKIINIHPSLIPSFCGEGYYGIHVHEKVLEYGVKLTGATAQFVTKDTDAGPIILQRAVEVKQDDTPLTLQRRVMEEAEWRILPQAISLFCEGRLKIEGRIVKILD
ncbi:MAG: phosphoribosylglycinamide formyltransferase [Clostridiales bacterium]|jgi:phosphoribosylglycinamide formyltransferase-1|nr:phosphoribosylglycinamide formyltransferase [Clostridiales bacterium]